VQRVPLQELESRWNRCRLLLKKFMPGAEGLLVFSRLNIYYLSGTFGSGILWLPIEGAPVLLCRRGLERAELESPLLKIFPFRSYKEIESLLQAAGSPLPRRLAAEMNGLSWALANSLTAALPGYEFLHGDRLLGVARGTKSDWELARLREAGTAHAEINALAVYRSRGHAVHGAGPQQPHPVGGKPARFVPVIDLEVFVVGFGEARKVEVSPVLGPGVEVYHSQHVDEGFIWGAFFHKDNELRTGYPVLNPRSFAFLCGLCGEKTGFWF